MADFEINIKTSADLKAAKETEANLQRQIAVTKTLGGDSSQLEQRLKGVQAAIKNAPENTGFLGKLRGDGQSATWIEPSCRDNFQYN